MDYVDAWWNWAVVHPTCASSDAVVDNCSQQYPNSAATQITIENGASHIGNTQSRFTRQALDSALETEFRVPPQSSCGFPYSPSTAEYSQSSNTGSFYVNSASGCDWDARVSPGSSWITITSPNPYTGLVQPETINFSIAANSSDVPRTGYISFGNDTGSRNRFSITQDGTCTYYISTNEDFFPVSGGNDTIQVSTQTGCAWSATSDTTWISFGSNQTGTGSGSFTFTVAPNSGNASLLGDIQVMGATSSQIITVYVGSPGGTPGTGTLTINGNGAITQYCYQTYYGQQCQTINESGGINVTIANVTEGAGYSGTGQEDAIASQIANNFNADSKSPVTASLNGTTITFTAKVNGANTNYPFSVSESWDTSNFSSPGYTATASGATLTGGTD